MALDFGKDNKLEQATIFSTHGFTWNGDEWNHGRKDQKRSPSPSPGTNPYHWIFKHHWIILDIKSKWRMK